MTLNDLLNSGIEIEGYVKIQCWEDDNNPTIYYEGYNIRTADENILDKTIRYIFPYNTSPNESAICIELVTDED